MTKTIRKLLGYLLIACLLLSGVSAMAETGGKKGTLTLTLGTTSVFTDPDGVEFEIFQVGEPSGQGTSWKHTSDFPSLSHLEDSPTDGTKEWSKPEADKMIAQIKEDLAKAKHKDSQKTANNGKAVFENLDAGIYYVRKSETNPSPRRLEVTPFLVAVPSTGSTTPYNVNANVKFDYKAPETRTFTVTKTWSDDNDFDGIQQEITVHLQRALDSGDPEDYDEVKLNKDNKWTYTWTGLATSDGDYQNYTYSVREDVPAGYTATISGGTITNSHTPEYGAVRVTKQVTVNGQATTGKLADGTYRFSITGPESYTAPKTKNSLNTVNETFEITITDGKSSSWTKEKLMPGTYRIRELTDSLGSDITVTGSAEQTIEVKAGTTATSNPAEVTFTNNRSVGSLKITKTVTVNSQSTTTTRVDGTYRFTVKGPSYPNGEVVSISVQNGRSNSVQLDNLILGEYEVTEVKTGLPTGVSYVSGDGKKTLAAANTAQDPLTFTFVNNRTVTQPPSEAGPTPTPRVTPTPTVTPELTPTPTPTPSPTPAVNVAGEKVWRDNGNAHNTRPASIKVQLLRDGTQISEITVSGGAGNRWSFNFGNLPKVDENGSEYRYTVRETPVEGYTTTVSGTTIINDLVPQTPRTYTSFNGNKIWKDNDNANGTRPNYIVVRLMQNGREIERRTVTAANGWQYSFQNVPVDDGYGNTYHYAIREDAVAGYVGRVEDFTVTNSKLPDRPVVVEAKRRKTGTPKPRFVEMGEPELEDLIDLFDYETPLWGRPLKTGDELPLYPIVFGGVGAAALIALVILMVVSKKRNRKAA